MSAPNGLTPIRGLERVDFDHKIKSGILMGRWVTNSNGVSMDWFYPFSKQMSDIIKTVTGEVMRFSVEKTINNLCGDTVITMYYPPAVDGLVLETLKTIGFDVSGAASPYILKNAIN